MNLSLVLCFITLASLLCDSNAFLTPSSNGGSVHLTPRLGCLPTCRALHPWMALQAAAQENGSPADDRENGRRKRFVRAIRRKLTEAVTFPARFKANFMRLSTRAKRLFIVQVLVLVMLFGSAGRRMYARYQNPGNGPQRAPIEVAYSSFLDIMEGPASVIRGPGTRGSEGSFVMDDVRIGPDRIVFRLTKQAEGEGDPQQLMAYTRKVPASPELVSQLRKKNIPFSAMSQRRANTVGMAVRSVILIFYLMILFRMYKTFTGNMGGSSSDAPGKLASSSSLPLASFNDIQGVDNAKQEVMELVDTLRNPSKYAILGARAPTGLLLEGPPGTGKTLLARATAAAAGVPLLYCSGSDFVEMFVGRGAARVRKLFERATKLSPCVIFIDELDALGKSRDSGSSFINSRGNDEAEQTLNQLLACMDGLDSSRRICVLAATNRREVLDPALIRPGRFDRIVKLELPNAEGRERILRVHAKKLPGFREGRGVDEKRLGSLGKGNKIDLSAVASVTPGLSGAELEFIVNEAAIRAVRRVSALLQEGNELVTPHVTAMDFEESLKNFYSTRKPKGGVADILKNVWNQ